MGQVRPGPARRSTVRGTRLAARPVVQPGSPASALEPDDTAGPAPTPASPPARAGNARSRAGAGAPATWRERLRKGLTAFTMPELSDEELKAFRVAQNESRMPLVVPTVVVGVILIASFIGWDLMREHNHVGPAALVRLGGGLALWVMLALVHYVWRPSFRTQALLMYSAFYLWQAAIGYALGPLSPLQLPGLLLVMFFSVLALPRANDALINVALAIVAVPVVLPAQPTVADVNYVVSHFVTVIALVWAATALIERMSAQSYAYGRRLHREASVDALTGVANRREFESTMVREMERARRMSLPLMLALADIDFFKKVNDRYGHDVGDLVLKGVSATMAGRIRRSDVLARIGGEEFALVLLGTEPVGAHVVLERLRAAVAQLVVPTPVADVRCTISIGVAEWHRDDTDWHAVYKRADRALYAAKEGGRDRVVEAPRLSAGAAPAGADGAAGADAPGSPVAT